MSKTKEALYWDSLLDKIHDKEEVCEHCLGTGEVSEDVFDNDSHELMRGVGTRKCICRLDVDKYSND